LKQLGVPMEGDALDEVFNRFKLVAETKLGGVNDDELLAIVRDGESVQDPAWSLETVQVVCGTTGLPTATVKMLAKDGTVHISAVVGTGPVDAAFKAIDALVGLDVVLTEYRVTAVTKGINSLAETTITVKPREGAEQKLGADVFKTNLQTGETAVRSFTATGADTDIVVSSARAYVIALNRMTEYVTKAYVVEAVASR
jgi:2-isopropylmalate synthase